MDMVGINAIVHCREVSILWRCHLFNTVLKASLRKCILLKECWNLKRKS